MMNNYYDYYNYLNNLNNKQMSSNMPNVNNYQTQNKKDLGYDTNPYTGFMRGNMFNNLYDQYKNYKPQELKPASEEEQALLFVQMYGFAAHDLGLYLDVYPNDTNAINLRNQYIEKYNEALANYENTYGPLNLDNQVPANIPWIWDTKKWPWEGTR